MFWKKKKSIEVMIAEREEKEWNEARAEHIKIERIIDKIKQWEPHKKPMLILINTSVLKKMMNFNYPRIYPSTSPLDPQFFEGVRVVHSYNISDTIVLCDDVIKEMV